jgi:hypothetical protein
MKNWGRAEDWPSVCAQRWMATPLLNVFTPRLVLVHALKPWARLKTSFHGV